MFMKQKMPWLNPDDLIENGNLEIKVSSEDLLKKINLQTFANAIFNQDIVFQELKEIGNTSRKYIIEVHDNLNGLIADIKLTEQGKEIPTKLPGFYVIEDPKDIILDIELQNGVKYLEKQILESGFDEIILPHSCNISFIQETDKEKEYRLWICRESISNSRFPKKFYKPIEYLDRIIPIILNPKISTVKKKQTLTSLACDFLSKRDSETVDKINLDKMVETIRRMVRTISLAELEPITFNLIETKKVYIPSPKKFVTDNKIKPVRIDGVYENIWSKELFEELVNYTCEEPGWFSYKHPIEITATDKTWE